VGGKKHRITLLFLSRLAQPLVSTLESTQCVDLLNDSTDSLARIFWSQSNGCIQLLEFRITNYSDHVLYHLCTTFRYYIPVPHSGNGLFTFGSLPSGKSLGLLAYAYEGLDLFMHPRELYIFLCVRTVGTAHTYQYLVVLVMSKDYTLRISYTSNIILTHKHFP